MFDNNWNILIAVLVLVLVFAYFSNCYEGFAGSVDAKNAEAIANVASLYNKDNLTITNLTTNGTLNSENINVKNLTATNFNIIPRGTIVLWSNTAGAIPAGWALCDGNNGTPNLYNRFVLGSNSGFGEVGGSWEHNHDAGSLYTALGVYWTNGRGNYLLRHPAGSGFNGSNKPVGSLIGTGTYTTPNGNDSVPEGTAVYGKTTNANHTPPFIRLAYIMKL